MDPWHQHTSTINPSMPEAISWFPNTFATKLYHQSWRLYLADADQWVTFHLSCSRLWPLQTRHEAVRTTHVYRFRKGTSVYADIYIYILPYHLPHLQFIAPSSWSLCISLYYSFHTLDLQSWNSGGIMHAAQLNASYTARAAKRAERVDMSLIPILATAGRLRICWNFVATCNGPETACCPEAVSEKISARTSQRTGFFANIGDSQGLNELWCSSANSICRGDNIIDVGPPPSTPPDSTRTELST